MISFVRWPVRCVTTSKGADDGLARVSRGLHGLVEASPKLAEALSGRKSSRSPRARDA